MPELPEVETVVRDLNQKIQGDKILAFESFWPKALKNISVEKFKKEILGCKILKAHRIGKNIFIDLSNGKTIYLHLKMTGHLLVKDLNLKELDPRIREDDKEEELDPRILRACLPAGRDDNKKDYFEDRVNQYIRHIFYLQDKEGNRKNVEFSDLRKFGKIVLIATDKIKTLPEIKSLGVDAVSEEFDFEYWQKILEKKKKMEIGRILMEQNLIAGIGNIYRAEILFATKINPWRIAGELKELERKEIFLAIKKILHLAIKLRGTSDSDYRDTSGAPGGFQKVLKVYNREKENCQRKKCQGIVKREKMAQRSVFWCDKCQR